MRPGTLRPPDFEYRHSTTADHCIHHAGGSTVVHKNQQQNPSMWNSLGVYELAPSQNHRVVLSDADGARVVADAIRVVPVEYDSVPVYADAVRFVANDAEAILTVHTDQLGSPQKLTDLSRSVVWDASFTPFGEAAGITGPANDNQRFPGQYFDAESGFHYNWFRDYDPSLGRYIQADPIGLAGGMNVYAYAGGNPVMLLDQRGLQAQPPANENYPRTEACTTAGYQCLESNVPPEVCHWSEWRCHELCAIQRDIVDGGDVIFIFPVRTTAVHIPPFFDPTVIPSPLPR